jgi:peptidoglycan hydrolase-like protein with peptidoglycan-binding domain
MAVNTTKKVSDKNGRKSKGKIKVNKRKKLTSCFFKNNIEIKKIFEGKAPMLGYLNSIDYGDKSLSNNQSNNSSSKKYTIKEQSAQTTGDCIKQFQKVLYLLLPQLKKRFPSVKVDHYSGSDAHLSLKKKSAVRFTNVFDKETRSYVIAFQQYFNIPGGGLIGPNTIAAMDAELERIKYYDCGGQNGIPEVKHNAYLSKDVGELTRVYQDSAYLYKIPDGTFYTGNLLINKPLPKGTKIYVIQDIDNSVPGWLYVQVNFSLKNDSNDYYSYNQNRMTGYIEKSKVWTKSNMPDHDSILYKIKPGDTVYSIIKSNYYHFVKDDYWNNTGNALRTEKSLFWKNEYYTQFKFYVNLLLYANNQNAVNYDQKQAIYLTYNGTEKINKSDWGIISNIHPLDNTNNSISNYEYFLTELESNVKFHWEYPTVVNNDFSIEQNTILIKEGYYIWIPSKIFADHLYAYINNRNSYFKRTNHLIRKFLMQKWDRGLGVSIEGALGATFGINMEVGAKVKLYRKFTEKNNEIVMCLSKSGHIKVGAEFGLGVAFFMGSGTKSGANIGLGGEIEAHESSILECEVEYEFPLYNTYSWENAERKDLPGLALFSALLNMGSISAEFIAISFTKLFTDFNIDPSNYLTKLKIQVEDSISGSASVMGGFKLSNSNDTNYWKQSGDINTDPSSPPWHIKKILGLANVQLGLDVEAKSCLGLEYNASYNELCFDSKTASRVPNSFDLTIYSNMQLLSSANASIGPLGGELYNLSPYTGIKVGFKYDNTSSISTFFIPNKSKIKNNVQPTFTAYSGYGIWDSFDGKALEYGISLIDTNTPYSITNFDSFLNLIDYVYLKKRFSILDLKKGVLKTLPKAQLDLQKIFNTNNKMYKFGLSAGVYVDFELRLKINDVNKLLNLFKDLLYEIRNQIAKKMNINQSQVSWVKVFAKFPDYINLLFNSDKVQIKVQKIINLLYNNFDFHELSVHGELAFGGATSLKVAAGIKAAVDVKAVLALSFDRIILQENEWIIDASETQKVNELTTQIKNLIQLHEKEIKKVFYLI